MSGGRAPDRGFVAYLAVGCVVAAVCAHAQAPVSPSPAPRREISHVVGNLYTARNNIHSTIFLVTADGIILADPLGTDFAEWLKTELDRRFGVPVKYVIYSHHHYDHAEGGAVFAGTAQFVAHQNMARSLDGRLPPLPGGNVDRNDNGRLEREEAVTVFVSPFERMDRNADGSLTPAEMFAEVRRPDVTYADRTTLMLAGQTVHLIHPGRNHSDDMTILHFPAERAVYAVDFVSVRSFPQGWGDFDRTPLHEWVASLKAIEAIEFDVLLPPGHGRAGTKADVVAFREFYEDLEKAVSGGLAEGKTLADLQQTVTLDKYTEWGGYSRRGAIVAAACNNLRGAACR